MRRGVTAFVSLVLMSGFAVACTRDSEDQSTNCEHITVAGPASLAAAASATCVPMITLDGHNYLFACVAFRPRQLITGDFAFTDPGGNQIRARFLKVIRPGDAIAVSGFGTGKCGHWQLAYDESLSRYVVNRIIRTGTTPTN